MLQLTEFITGDGSFREATSLSLLSMLIDDWLIWSSYTNYNHYRRLFILDNNRFEFGKCDNQWLIDLIFLISQHSFQERNLSTKQVLWLYQVIWFIIDWFDLPKLIEVKTGNASFCRTSHLRLESIVIIDLLIWSSWVNFIYWRR